MIVDDKNLDKKIVNRSTSENISHDEEFGDTGVIKYYFGLPSEERRKQLQENGYIHISNDKYLDGTPYEQWIK